MRRLIYILLLLPFLCNAQIRYVATDGDDDTGDGSIGNPYATWQKGIDETEAGDTLYIRGGVYLSYAIVEIDTTGATKYGHCGTADKPILIAGYPADITADNWPILDCSIHCDSITNPFGDVYNAGINMNKVQYITFRCLEVRNVFQCDSVLNGAIAAGDVANITYDRIRVHNIGERGFYHTSGAWSYADSMYAVDVNGASPAEATPIWSQPDTTRWINCDVWDICDTLGVAAFPNPGNGGDAWKTISYNGNYMSWEGCRAWNYSDDGWDPNSGKREFSNCWAMASNKYAEFGIEGNGFKTSAFTETAFLYYTEADSLAFMADSMVIQTNCLAMFCPGAGFYHGPESNYTDNPRYYNNTAYWCGIGYWSFLANEIGNYDTLTDVYRNNIAYGTTQTNAWGGAADTYIYVPCENSNNTWIKPPYYGQDNPAFSVTDADFSTVDSTTLVSLFTASRQADGSLPTQRPMMLASTSDLIDGGIDGYWVNSYNGSAPDLGYSESGGTQDTVPIIAFTYSPSTVYKDSTVTFTDNSLNTPTTWDWYFEGADADSSALENPTAVWSSTGTYDVELIATNAYGSDTLLKSNYITVLDGGTTAPVAAFSVDKQFIRKGGTVTFTDASTNTPTSWSWTIGDPVSIATSTEQNPSFRLTTPGVHTVILIATNAGGNDSEVKTGYITVTNYRASMSNK